jgi:hypothetical protein
MGVCPCTGRWSISSSITSMCLVDRPPAVVRMRHGGCNSAWAALGRLQGACRGQTLRLRVWPLREMVSGVVVRFGKACLAPAVSTLEDRSESVPHPPHPTHHLTISPPHALNACMCQSRSSRRCVSFATLGGRHRVPAWAAMALETHPGARQRPSERRPRQLVASTLRGACNVTATRSQPQPRPESPRRCGRELGITGVHPTKSAGTIGTLDSGDTGLRRRRQAPE